MGGTKRDDVLNQAKSLIWELGGPSYHDSVQVPLAADGRRSLERRYCTKVRRLARRWRAVLCVKWTRHSIRKLFSHDVLEVFVRRFEVLDLTGTHSRETSLANARPGPHTNASSLEGSIAAAHCSRLRQFRTITHGILKALFTFLATRFHVPSVAALPSTPTCDSAVDGTGI